MTNEEMLNRELQHLVKMAETSSTWAEYATWKAGEYARRWPFLYAELLRLLSASTSPDR